MIDIMSYMLGYRRGKMSEYKSLKYLESNGTQWMILDYDKITKTDELYIRYTIEDGYSSRYPVIYGVVGLSDPSDEDGASGYITAFISDEDDYTIDFSWGMGGIAWDNGQDFGEWHEISTKVQAGDVLNVYLDDYSSDVDAFNGQSVGKPMLFGRHNLYDETQNRFSCSKISAFYYVRDGHKICELQPRMRKSDNAVGMYDLVTGKFYTNQGTGTFGYETLDGTYVAPVAGT